MTTKEEAFRKLREKIAKFDNSNKFDFSNLKKFMKIYLNTEDEAEREQLAEKFKKRHMEAYDFLKNNPELMKAESEIVKITDGDFADFSEKNETQATNFFELIKEHFDNDC